MAVITARERVRAAARGEVLDRPPFAVWRHFYREEQPGRARDLARALVAFVRAHDLDLLKYNPRAQYHAEPWGTRYRYDGEAHPTVERLAVRDPADWRRIHALPAAGGVFDEMREGIRAARESLPDVPLVMTVFTPLAICERLAGRERTLADLRARTAEVLSALEAVAETFARFAAACVDDGADGIFLATTAWAQRDVLDDDEYEELGRPYDLRVLDAVRGAPFNVLHVCGPNARVLPLARYPVAAVSWNVGVPGTPSPSAFLAEVSDRVGIGGLSDAALAGGATLADEVDRLPRARWIAAGGCTIPPETPGPGIDRARERVAGRTRDWTR